ncbi:hypothetical protein N2152v2_010695 [Parachlorella kessleri]
MPWNAVAVANVLWAHAVLGHGSKALVNKALRQLDLLSVTDSTRCFHTLVQALARLGQPHAGYLRRLSAALVQEAQHRQQAQQVGGQQGQQEGGSLEQPVQVQAEQRQDQGYNYFSEGNGTGSSIARGSGAASASSTSNHSMASSFALQGQPALLGQLHTQQLCLFVYSLASLGCTDGKAVLVCLAEIAARDLTRLSSVSLCQVVRAMVVAGVYHPEACDAIAAAVAQLPGHQLDGQASSRLIHDYGLIFQKVLVGGGGNPSHRIKWQAAVRNFVNREPARRAMLCRLAQHAQQEVSALGTVSLSSLVWGLATLGQREAPLLDAVADRAMQLGTELDGQAVASICWAYAALSHDHPLLLDSLATTALSLLQHPARREEFSGQTVPMLAMGFAVLNHCEGPAARAMLQALALRAGEILHELTPQGLGNLGWALAVAQAFPASLARPWRAAVADCLPQCGPLELNQLHQAEVALRLEGPSPPLLRQQPGGGGAAEPYDSLLSSLYQSGRLRSMAKRGWEREQQWGQRTITRFQMTIYNLLVALGVPCDLEYLGAGGEFSADIAIPSHHIAVPQASTSVEADGPSHFMANSRREEGGTAMKRRLLGKLGWRVVPIPYFDWPESRGEQIAYLVRALGAAGLDVSVPPRARRHRQRPVGSRAGRPPAAAGRQTRRPRQAASAGAGAGAEQAGATAGVVPAQVGQEQGARIAADLAAGPSPGAASGMAASSSGDAPPAAAAAAVAVAVAAAMDPAGSGARHDTPGASMQQREGSSSGPAGPANAAQEQPGSSGVQGAGHGPAEDRSPSSGLGAEGRERARRLSVLRHQSGKLSRMQLLVRQRQGREQGQRRNTAPGQPTRRNGAE